MSRVNIVRLRRRRDAGEKLSVQELKALIRDRDGYRCVLCGLTEEEHRKACGRALEVHRPRPGQPYSFQDNGQTVCGRCHAEQSKAPFGGSDHATLRLPRQVLLDALGLESLDGISLPRLTLRLFRLLSVEVKQQVAAEVRRRPFNGKRSDRHLARSISFRPPAHVRKAIEALAREEGRPATQMTLLLIEQALKNRGCLPEADQPPS